MLRSGASADALVDGAAAVQRWLADALARTGVATLALVLAVLLGVSAVSWWRHRLRSASGSAVGMCDERSQTVVRPPSPPVRQ